MSAETMLKLFKNESVQILKNALSTFKAENISDTQELSQSISAVRGASILAGLTQITSAIDNWKEFLCDPESVKLDYQRLKDKIQKLYDACQDQDYDIAEISLDELKICAQTKQADTTEQEKESSASDTHKAPEPISKAAETIDINPMMLEMFQTEAQERIEALTTQIMNLEDNPADAKCLESLMRAAHSIKGAARIIGLKPVSDLAHVLEDYFVAAQQGELTVNADVTDILLAGVDGLANLSFNGETNAQPYLNKLESLRSNSPQPNEPQAPEQALAIPEQETPVASPKQPKAQSNDAPQASNQIVRVAAQSISKIMGLAGETVVQSQNLEPLTQSLINLKSKQMKIIDCINNIESSYENSSDITKQLCEQLRLDAAECQHIIQQHIDEFDNLSRSSSDLSERLYNEVLSSRMRPFSEGTHGFSRMVRDLARELNKKVKFQIIGKDTKVDRDVLDKLESPLTHLLRNAIDHGLQTAQEREGQNKTPENHLTLQALHWGGFLNVKVIDDGRGISTDKIKSKIIERGLHTKEETDDLNDQEILEFLFLPGFSTTSTISEISGRGVGLDVVRNMLHELGGSVSIDNRPGKGVCFNLRLPVTRSVAKVLLTEIGGEVYAIALNRIERLLKVSNAEILSLEGKSYINNIGDNITLIEGAEMFDATAPEINDKQPVVVVKSNNQLYGLKVQKFLGEKEQVIKPLDERLGKVNNISAAIILEDGRLALVIDIDDLIVNAGNPLKTRQASNTTVKDDANNGYILVIDDSPTVREMEKRTLEAAGYHVQTAVDGVDGWVKARGENFDLIISDIDMPRMNGIELTRNLRATPEAATLPIMLVSYKDRPEDYQAGLEAGANYFMNKGGFNDNDFIETTRKLIAGERVI